MTTVGRAIRDPRSKILTQMAMGFARSRVLAAAARLGIADALQDKELYASELAAICKVHGPSLYRLLRALASIGIVVEGRDERFALAPKGAALRRDHPHSEWASVIFWGEFRADSWSYLADCVQTGESAALIMARENAHARWSRELGADSIFGQVMGSESIEEYEPIIEAWDFTNAKIIADLGGAGGGLIAAALKAYPRAQGILIDQPQYVENARRRFLQEDLANRCEAHPGDITRAAPPGADVYMLKHVLHQFDDSTAMQVLASCRAVMTETARVLVIEFILPEMVSRPDRTIEACLMSDLNMLTSTGGKERSLREWESIVCQSGLKVLQVLPIPASLLSIIEIASSHVEQTKKAHP